MEWQKKPLGTVADLCLGKMLDQNKNRGEPLPYLANVNVRWGEFELNNLRTMRFELKEKDRYGLKFGDIVMCEGGEPGRCAIWKDQIHGMMIQKALHRIRPKDYLDYRFLFYSLLNIGKSKGFDQYFTGATIKHLPGEKLAMVQVNIPPLPIQRRIASILSAYDDLIENNTRRIAILEEMARRIYEEWFVKFKFPGHEMVKMVDSELGKIPEGWKVKAVPDAIDISPTTKLQKDGQKPFVPMNCLSDKSMVITRYEMREGNSGSKFKNGDTLFARITPCLENGKTGFVQFLPNDNAIAFGSTEFIVLRSRTLSSEIVYLLSRTNSFRDNAIKSMSGATGRQRVRESCFSSYLFAHPNKEIINRFTELVSPMFRGVFLLQRKNFNLRTTRDFLLPKLISGEIDVSKFPEPQEDAAA
ncbi:MAG: restriction endonuclease subunit S [Candidatus Competibacteraceae bacterium]|nr:MAG: restriction endonuclease subunit S [Candidatus Competibacteraceae bacterium]